MSDDILSRLSSSMREKRAARRNEVAFTLSGFAEDLSRMDKERDDIENAAYELVVHYVAERLVREDRESVTILKNQVPERFRKLVDRAVRLFEAVHGHVPDA